MSVHLSIRGGVEAVLLDNGEPVSDVVTAEHGRFMFPPNLPLVTDVRVTFADGRQDDLEVPPKFLAD